MTLETNENARFSRNKASSNFEARRRSEARPDCKSPEAEDLLRIKLFAQNADKSRQAANQTASTVMSANQSHTLQALNHYIDKNNSLKKDNPRAGCLNATQLGNLLLAKKGLESNVPGHMLHGQLIRKAVAPRKASC